MSELREALERVMGLAEQATDGEWCWSENGNIYGGPEGRFADVDEVCAVYTDDEATGSPNAPAIVAAINLLRTHGPALLAAVRDGERLRDALVGELYCSDVKGTNDFALSDADGYPIDLKALEGERVRLVRVQEGL